MKPNPLPELVSSGIDALHAAILENLCSKRSSPTVIPFRHDIFQYLFHKKGTIMDTGKYIFLNEEDFAKCSWPEKWDQIPDHVGYGVRILYPVKARLFLGRSPKNHIPIAGGMKPLPRYYIEKLSIQCLKKEIAVSIFY